MMKRVTAALAFAAQVSRSWQADVLEQVHVLFRYATSQPLRIVVHDDLDCEGNLPDNISQRSAHTMNPLLLLDL